MVLVVLIWGGNYVASKLAIATIPPLAFTAMRFTLGSVFLWILVSRLEPEHTLPKGMFRPVLLLGVVGNTLYQVCFINGLSRTTATNTAIILSSMPAAVTLVSGLLGLEILTARQRLAPILASVGVLLVVAAKGLNLGHGDWLGDLLMLVAVACWTAYTLGLRALTGRMSALTLTGWTMVTGTPGLLLAGVPSLVSMSWGAVPWQAWVGLAYATLLSLVAAYILWSRAVGSLGASRASLYTCFSPLVAALVAMAVLGERPGPAHMTGGALIAAGVLLGNVRTLRPAPPEG
jgi:drug/metabolite transporter (DMT)-like permease